MGYNPIPESWLTESLQQHELTLTLETGRSPKFQRGDVIEIVDYHPGAGRERLIQMLDWSTKDVRIVTQLLHNGKYATTQPTAEARAHPCGSYVRVISRAMPHNMEFPALSPL